MIIKRPGIKKKLIIFSIFFLIILLLNFVTIFNFKNDLKNFILIFSKEPFLEKKITFKMSYLFQD